MNPWLETIYGHSPIPFQNLYVSWYGRRVRRQRFNHAFDRWMALFERSQWWGQENLGAHQDQALAGLVAHCYETVPFYRKVMEDRGLRPADVTTRRDLHKLPIISKDTIRRDPRLNNCRQHPRFQQILGRRSTQPPSSAVLPGGITITP